jgi:hypothetical protein
MAWIVWLDNDGRREYVRRITPQFASFTLDRADAARWPTRTAARAALKGSGFTPYPATREAADPPPEAPVFDVTPDPWADPSLQAEDDDR